jgi:hypothetical protein
VTVTLDGEKRAARSARDSLYVVGGVFAALGIALELVPALAEVTPSRAARGCVLFGALILSIGRFAPDRFVRRFDGFMRRT